MEDSVSGSDARRLLTTALGRRSRVPSRPARGNRGARRAALEAPRRAGDGLGEERRLLHRHEAALRARPTILISPLLSLMRDQICMAERLGVRALSINEGQQREPALEPVLHNLGQSHHSLLADWGAGLAVPAVLQLDDPVAGGGAGDQVEPVGLGDVVEQPGALARIVGEQAQLELVDQVEPHERPPEADAARDHDVAVAAQLSLSISSAGRETWARVLCGTEASVSFAYLRRRLRVHGDGGLANR